MKKQNVIRVNSGELEEINVRVTSAHAMLELVHAHMDDPVSVDAVYGILFDMERIADDIDALIQSGTEATA